MGKHVVYIPDTMGRPSRRKMTSEQWLAEYKMRGGRTRVFDLPAPITIVSTEPNEKTTHRKTCKKSTEFFYLLAIIAAQNEMIASVSWHGGKLGPHALYTLNQALRTFPLRKGGRNVVRYWLEKVANTRSPLRSDVSRLLSYLEIRPVFTKNPAPHDAPSKYYVYSPIKHKAVTASGHKKPRNGKK